VRIFLTSGAILSYIVSLDGIITSPDNVEAVRRFSVPKNARDIRFFLRLASFYRRTVPNFAEIAKPPTELTRKDGQFKSEGRLEAALVRVNEILCSERLSLPKF
jgi:hypothetical protein